MQCVAVCCSVLQCDAIVYDAFSGVLTFEKCVAVCCSVLQCDAIVYDAFSGALTFENFH